MLGEFKSFSVLLRGSHVLAVLRQSACVDIRYALFHIRSHVAGFTNGHAIDFFVEADKSGPRLISRCTNLQFGDCVN
jgi:hypothetical protein